MPEERERETAKGEVISDGGAGCSPPANRTAPAAAEASDYKRLLPEAATWSTPKCQLIRYPILLPRMVIGQCWIWVMVLLCVMHQVLTVL